MTNITKSIFFRDYWTKSDGVCAEIQIISYSFIILKHIQVDLQIWKLLILKVRLYFFLGGGTNGILFLPNVMSSSAILSVYVSFRLEIDDWSFLA